MQHATSIATVTLGAFVLAREMLALEGDATTSVAFLTLALAQLWFTFAVHHWREPALHCAVARCRAVHAAIAICIALLLLALLVPPLAQVLH